MHLCPPEGFPTPHRMVPLDGKEYTGLIVSAQFKFEGFAGAEVKHLDPRKKLELWGAKGGTLLLEIRDRKDRAVRLAHVLVVIDDEGEPVLTDAHVSYPLRALFVCETLIEIAGNLVGRSIRSVVPNSLMFL